MAGAQAALAAPAPSEGTTFANNYHAMGRSAKPRTANEPGRADDMEKKDKDVRDSEGFSRRRALFESSEMPGAQRADVQPRERFVESAYWNPSVVTNRDGKARVTFRAPPALSEYRITARGVTGGDTLAGQMSAALRVKKDFFVDLKVP